jgi:hypothetical protein
MVLIHSNIITDVPYGFNFDSNSTAHIYVRDNILENVGAKEHTTETFVDWLNNVII